MNNENLVNYKSYIKQLLLDNIDSISFNRPKVRHALERAFSKQMLSCQVLLINNLIRKRTIITQFLKVPS